jgi:quercetin dioxygenase-like cupin family protein
MPVRRLATFGTAIFITVLSGGPSQGQEPKVDRTILQRQDLAGVPGYELLFVEATIPVGGREGRHTHPGTMIGYLTQGSFTMEVEGTLTDYEAGTSVVIGPGVVHEGINRGKVPIRALVTFIVPKGQPLSAMVSATP